MKTPIKAMAPRGNRTASLHVRREPGDVARWETTYKISVRDEAKGRPLAFFYRFSKTDEETGEGADAVTALAFSEDGRILHLHFADGTVEDTAFPFFPGEEPALSAFIRHLQPSPASLSERLEAIDTMDTALPPWRLASFVFFFIEAVLRDVLSQAFIQAGHDGIGALLRTMAVVDSADRAQATAQHLETIASERETDLGAPVKLLRSAAQMVRRAYAPESSDRRTAAGLAGTLIRRAHDLVGEQVRMLDRGVDLFEAAVDHLRLWQEEEARRPTLVLPANRFVQAGEWLLEAYCDALRALGNELEAEGCLIRLDSFSIDREPPTRDAGRVIEGVLTAQRGGESWRIVPAIKLGRWWEEPPEHRGVALVEEVHISWPALQADRLGVWAAHRMGVHLGEVPEKTPPAQAMLQRARDAFGYGQHQASRLWADAALTRAQAAGDAAHQGIALYWLAQGLDVDEKIDQAKVLLRTAIDRLADVDAPETAEYLWGSHSMLGAFALHENDLATAKVHYQAALRLSQSTNSPFSVAHYLKQLGRVALADGRLSDAQSYCEEAVAGYRAIRYSSNARRLEGEARSLLGDVLQQSGDLSAARAAYEQALSLYAHFPDQLGRQRRAVQRKLQQLG